MVELGIHRLCTLTVANASTDDVAIGYLEKRFSKTKKTHLFQMVLFHVRCCAHILKLVVKDGLNEMKDSVTRIRDAMKYVRSSPQRLNSLNPYVEKDRIPLKNSLILDVPTRWNSTYLMLDVATKF